MLTPRQTTVIALIANGSSITTAAEQADVHRTTIYHWLRTSTEFNTSLQQARTEQQEHLREQLQSLATTAFNTLQQLLTDPKTPAGVRLKAALEVLKYATAPQSYPATEQAAKQAQRHERDESIAASAELVAQMLSNLDETTAFDTMQHTSTPTPATAAPPPSDTPQNATPATSAGATPPAPTAAGYPVPSTAQSSDSSGSFPAPRTSAGWQG